MKSSNWLFFCLSMLFLSGCSYQTAVDVSPAYDVYSSYDDKVPGNWAIFIDVDELGPDEYKFDGANCSFHNYPMDLSSAFNQSAVRTIENVVTELQQVNSPLTADQMISNDFHGLIVLRGQDVDADLDFNTGFWSSSVEAEVDLTVSILVDGRDGRLLGTTVAADGDAEANAGGFCEGGAEALGEAGGNAIQSVMERVAERISNARKIREYSY